MSISRAYSAWAANYDADPNLTRDLDEEVTRRLLGDDRIPVVVEAGCGTGKNTEYFSRIADEVHALDFSEGMLAVARSRVTSPNVLFQQADLTSDWPCPAKIAHLVSFNLVLEHVELLTPVLRQATDTLVPGGRLFISELHPFKQYQSRQARFLEATGQEVKGQAYTHHISDFLKAAEACGLELVRFNEWWHHKDQPDSVPRLATFLFRLPSSGAAT
ncbi:bifunctional 2-polyprenyl-6-hydroxyphenol methylase/3-demethylubiquinol 3-O-methyltransferase UbiG [Rhodoferax sp. PAMC 29310]|uniref:class I SAM-dependent methyltransferase n=1 Tax=Rhodoferax sp. PAMC 29310 TaxID=2822760 RepID=UPI001B32478E|nr:class I SAM-dependent methyltransferase [Rhodoferax sp. PAMC 29310]